MRTMFLAAMLSIAGASLGWAQHTEDEQRAACGFDVFRYCLIHIPDRERISECMIANRAQLSPVCRNVVDAGLAAKRKTR